MSITAFFRRLGAPLANSRWSWGAVRSSDGAVFMRVWQDRKVVQDRIPTMMLTHNGKYADDTENLGYKERLAHVELVRGGAACYMIMCVADDPVAIPRKIKSFNAKDIFVGGELQDADGDTWVKVADRVAARTIEP